MVRALDRPRTIHAPLRQKLKTQVEAIAEETFFITWPHPSIAGMKTGILSP
jgi:hypothetical protein